MLHQLEHDASVVPPLLAELALVKRLANCYIARATGRTAVVRVADEYDIDLVNFGPFSCDLVAVAKGIIVRVRQPAYIAL